MNDPKNSGRGMEKMQRRSFLAASTLGGLSMSLGALPTGGAHRLSHAREPISLRKSSKWKLSLAAYSYRDLLTSKEGAPAKMDLFGFIDECAAMQLDGVELTGYYMPQPPTAEYLRELRCRCFQLGLSVSGTATRSDFSRASEDPKQIEEIAHVKRWIDFAEQLHAPTLRVFAGVAQPNIDAATTHQRMVSALRELAEYAGRRGIYLGLENHGGPTETAEGLLKLLHDIDSPWVAVNLDTGNFRGPVDPYEQMAMVAPYAVNVQVKASLPMPDGKRHAMDYDRVFQVLRAANYRGYVVLEYEDDGDVTVECRKHIESIRKYTATT